MIWLILVPIVFFLLWYHLIRPMNHFKKMGVKQCKPWPLFGDQWRVIFTRMSIAEFVEYIYNAHPNTRYTGFYQSTIPTLAIKDPELIKQITIKDFESFTDHLSFIDSESDPLWAGNLFALKGQKWREMRATLTGSFTSSKMKNMFCLINEAAENFLEYFLDKSHDITEVEMKDTFTRFTNDVIATAAFGIEVDSLKEPNNTFYLMGKKLLNFSLGTSLKIIAYLVMPKVINVMKIKLFNEEASSFFRKVIRETIEMREQKGIVRPDMINLLLETRKGIKSTESESIETELATVKESSHDINQFKQLKNLTNEDITSQALIFFLAGFDSVSTAMCFGSYELALAKDVQDKLHQEIQSTHKTNGEKLTYDVLLKMKYLDMVVSEILRKWPPAVAIDRVCTKPYIIEPMLPDESPVHLKRGDALWFPYHGIHRSPEFYPNPEKFDPERFSDENKDNIRPYTYLPFGAGPRNCIGSRFALLEIKTLFYHLLLNFEIVPIERTSIPLILERHSFKHTAANGFWLGLKKRT